MRTPKNNIELNVDSALALMQEIYNDVVENRNTASQILRKMMSFMKDAEDMSTIGPVIKEQQKIINDTVEKKLTLSKLQSTIWEKSQQKSVNDFTLSEIDDSLIQDLLKKDIEQIDSEGQYKLNK